MDRITLEVKLHTDRAWLLETYAAMSPDDLTRPATASEHDPASWWSAKDHLAHLAGIEKNFNRMIRRYLDGDRNPVGLTTSADGAPRTREQIMQGVHAMNEAWVARHRDRGLSDVVASGEEVRAETLALLATLTDAQLGETLPGAPWADGTIGGVLGVNGDHARRHLDWVRDGWAASAATPHRS
jgi:hypothetical protein